MALLFRLSEFGQTFATRGRGSDLREELLTRVADDDRATVSFAGVTHVSYSFADEFAGRLHAEAEAAVEFTDMVPTVERIVARAVQRRAAPAASL